MLFSAIGRPPVRAGPAQILAVPVIVGIALGIRLGAGRERSRLVKALMQPGLWLQMLTTKPPTPDMIEVAIRARGAGAAPAERDRVAPCRPAGRRTRRRRQEPRRGPSGGSGGPAEGRLTMFERLDEIERTCEDVERQLPIPRSIADHIRLVGPAQHADLGEIVRAYRAWRSAGDGRRP